MAHGLSNEETLEKFRRFTNGIADDRRRGVIERLVLDIENVSDIMILLGGTAGRKNGD